MAQRIDIVSADDWRAYYLDGKIEYQHHSIPEPDLLKMLLDSRPVEGAYWWYDVDEGILDVLGEFPDNFSDIPQDQLVKARL